MLSNDERTIIAAFAQRLTARHPTIVELGCYIGGSTLSLIDGLRGRGADLVPTRPVIHAYDLFRANPFMVEHSLSQWGVERGDDFEHVFMEVLADDAGLVTVHSGDLLDERWNGAPIDLLFVDILWSWALNQHVVGDFYTALRPGAAVVHQDFVYSFWPWLVISMEWFVQRGLFAYRSYGPPSTVAFELLRPFDAHERSVNFLHDFSVDDKAALMTAAANRFQGVPSALLRLSQARLYVDHDPSKAVEIYDQVRAEYQDDIVDTHLGMISGFFTKKDINHIAPST